MRRSFTFLSWILVLFVFLTSTQRGLSQCGPLTTLYAGNNGQDGVMFDITALQSVNITNFSCDAYGNTHDWEIYYKAGSHVGFENNAAAWTLLGTANNVPGNPRNSPTVVPITFSVMMCAGETGAFYITSTSSSGSISYTNGSTVGTVYSSDANIQIRQGTGKDYPFAQNFTTRIPNITCYYSCTQSCCTPPTMSSTPTSCSGVCDGTATATVGAGGVPPYSYQWDAAAGNQTTQTATGLCAGTYDVEVTDNTGCVATGTVTVASGPPSADATINPAGPFCINDPSVNLTAATAGGTWSGTGITNASTGAFSPSAAGAGTWTITYTIPGACGDVATTNITVNGAQNSTINPAGPFCPSDPAVTLTAASPGGIWTGTGIVNSSSGLFDPAVAGPGTWTILYQITGACGSFSTSSITVNAGGDATITSAGPYCENSPAVTLTSTSSGGTWSGTGITNTATGLFDPSVAGVGSWTITYTIPGQCGDVDDQVINVNPAADATITPAGPFCITDPAVNLSAADPGGMWIGAGITNNTLGTFNPATAGLGTWTIVYNIAGACGDVQTTPITVTNGSNATITPIGPLCSAGNSVNLTAADPGGTWSGTGITDPVAGTFSPQVSGAGNFTITYTIGGNCGDTDTQVITVNQSGDATIDPIPPLCTSDSPLNFTAASPGGTWSGAGITNNTLGTFNPALVGAGTWIVTYTISGSCGDSDTQVFTIGTSGNPTITSVPPVCAGGSSFNLSAATGGGTWSGTGITNASTGTFDPTVSGPGSWTVTYSLGGSCPSSDTEVIQVSSPIVVNTTLDQQSNCNQADGVASVSASGGTVANNYGYSWNSTPTQSSSTATGLAPGTYTVTVSDDLNCSSTGTVNVTTTAGFTASISSSTDASCYQVCDGDAMVTANSGYVSPLSYSWNTSPAQTGATASNLCAGSYNVTVTDNAGCTATASVTISEPAQLSVTAATSADPICIGSSSNLSATPSGGTAPFSYSWSASPADPTLTASSQNPTVTPTVNTTYTITVTDANGCTATDQVTVNVSSAIILNTTLDQQSNCGQSDGVVSVSVSGGIVANDYAYSWNSTPGQSTATATGLAAGSYTVTVTDDAGCSETANATVTTTAGFTASISNFTDASCYQTCDGMATVAITAGSTSPLSYSWNSSPTQSTATATNLCTGTYNVTVTDAVGCSATASVTIAEPTQLTATASASASPICSGETSDLTASGVGGTPTYSYAWTASPNDPSLNGSSQNPTVSPSANTTYTLTITDGNGCTATDQVVVNASSAIVLNATMDQQSNCGQPDGEASVSASGGTIANNYSYSWDSTPAQATSTATGLIPGTYTITVTDDYGCWETTSVVVTSTAGFTATITTFSDLSCYQGCDGAATVLESAGSVAPVSYSWNTSPPQSLATATGLCAGTYDVTITDNTGCSAATTVIISEPTELTVTTSASSTLICEGQSTDLNATPSGGTQPYVSYSWTAVPADPSLNGSSQNPTVSPTANTVYTVTATDANGCTASASVTVNLSPAISLNMSLDQSSICQQATGIISVSASGGTVANDYQYSWNTTPSQTTATASNLVPGTYSVTVTDDVGCSEIGSVDVTVSGGFTASVSSYTDISCYQACDGTATATTDAGSVPPLSYTWNTNPAQTTAMASSLCPGTYDVIIQDSDGCADTASVTITEPALLEVDATASQSPICIGQSTTLDAAPIGGTQPFNYSWIASPADASLNPSSQSPSVSPIITTTYSVILTDANGCSTTDSVTVDVATAILPVAVMDQQSHCGQPDGAVSVSASGGMVANDYGYSWDSTPVQTTAAATGLAPGTYTVTVTDDIGCTATASAVVTATTGFTATITTSTDVSCNGLCDGEATVVDGSGSISPFTYSWNSTPAQSGATATGLCAGTYDVTITDAVGCQGNTSVTINEPAALTVNASASASPICIGQSTDLSTAVNGGTQPIASYSWSANPADATLVGAVPAPTVSPIVTTTYSVTVLDANGCSATHMVTVNVSPPIVLSTSMDQQSNCGLPDGVVSVSASGGIVANGYGYSWNSSPSQSTSTATGLVPGTYTVTVTDDVGCSATADVDVTPTVGFTASISASADALCYQSCDGSATVVVGNGNIPPLTYSWNSSPAQSGANATSLCAGTYEVLVTDAVGCTATASVTISEPSELVVSASSSASSICIGESASLTSAANGGTTPYVSYDWTASPADQTLNATAQNQTVSPEQTTAYQVTVTDANGCTATDQVAVTVLPPLSLSVVRPTVNPDTAICPYDMATLNLAATGGDGNYSFFLQPDLNTPISLPMQVQPNSTTTYVFVVEDGCSTPSATAQSTVTVHVLPEIAFEVDDPAGCHVHSAQFTDNTSPTPVSWSWNFGDEASNSNSSSASSPYHTFSAPGLFDVSLSIQTATGCVVDTVFEDFVEVYPLPVADFIYSPSVTTVLSGPVTYTDQSYSDIESWYWNFGTGDTSWVQNPVYAFQDTGVFVTWLTVTTIHGCQATTRGQVRIEPDFTFYVPNTFTPNGDERNDFFRGYGEGVDWDTYQVHVYNRWGEEIFYSSDIEFPWDGSFKGKPVEMGVYVWSISVMDVNGESHTYRGHVNLLR